MLITHNYSSGLTAGAMTKFVTDFGYIVTTSKIEQVKTLIEQLSEITEKMTDDELTALDGCSTPHVIANLKYYNDICEKRLKSDKSYLDFFREFLKSEDYEKFTEYKARTDGQRGEKSGSGGTQYSAESVEDRQYILDGFIEDFFDVPLPHNGVLVNDETADTPDVDIADETHTPNITHIKNTADVTDAEFNGNNTDDFVEAVLNSD